MRRGAEFSIKLGNNELMNSRLSATEQALATIACEKIRSHERPRILIGGLGMGFTLRAALAALDARRGSSSPNWCRRWWPGRAVRWQKFSATA